MKSILNTKYFQNLSRRKILLIAVPFIFLAWFWFCLPYPLFEKPLSVVLEDKNGELLGALIADDGQWRFPEVENVSQKFASAITTFEDKRFYWHPGVDPVAFSRALYQNITSGKVISGGSTLTMQVIRLARENRSRTVFEKAIEMALAVRLEVSYSKNEILSLYASNAPFGGNVVGLEAASWRYFGRTPEKLSWAESCVLAVLPNSPALIHPGKNRKLLKLKRDNLLKKLLLNGTIDSMTCELAIEEPLPDKPYPLPKTAPHLLQRAASEVKSGAVKNSFRVRSTIDENLQKQVNEVIARHYKTLSGNEIYNASALVADIETGEILAYTGNTTDRLNRNDNQVDVITAPRSTGSIMKPFLYTAMLSSGELLPKTILPDIPTNIGGFNPMNFDLGYDGAIHADKALARSVNIPAVRELQKYRYERFHSLLKKLGITTLNESAGHYGLSLILGGAEATLWDLTGVYASLARNLEHSNINAGLYYPDDYHPLSYIRTNYPIADEMKLDRLDENSLISAGAIWQMIKAMVEVERPEEENFWREFGSSKKIAWKTGTSFGFRDAWSIGFDHKYIVAVWAGNADGEGRPGLSGISTAAPVLFDIFNLLPAQEEWYQRPEFGMIKIPTCRQSGYRAGEFCTEIDTIWSVEAGLQFQSCPYHKLVHLDPAGKFRVNDNCISPSQMMHKSWYVLPPAMEYFYKLKNPEYKSLPEFLPGCSESDEKVMELIYPRDVNKVYIPVNLDGSRSSVIFEIAHRKPESVIYWHIDNEYIGMTQNFHQMPVNSSPGSHILTVVDENGNVLTKKLEVLNK